MRRLWWVGFGEGWRSGPTGPGPCLPTHPAVLCAQHHPWDCADTQ